jgi:hypothetical protein
MNFLGDQKWLVYILPGFIALFVASFISDFPQIRDTQLPIVYIALTALSVAIPLLCVHIYGRLRKIPFDFDATIHSLSVLSAIFACSILFGFAFGIAHTTDYVSRGLRAVFGKDIILTSSHFELIKYLFKNAYNDKFPDGQPYIEDRKQRTNRYALFNFRKELGRHSFEGVITEFFGSTDRPQVYLSPACQIDGGKVTLIQGPGVWLDLEGIDEVSFVYSSCSKCASEIAIAAGQTARKPCPFYNTRAAQ